MKLIKFEEINSTNDYFKENRDIQDWDTVYAVRQSGGRGRNGKKWVSSEGGAWFTTVIKENKSISMQEYIKLPLVVGTALLKSIEEIGLQEVKLKWPNDIYIKDKKVCGILVEKSGENFIVGIGINVNMEKMEEEVENIATSLYIETGKKYNIEDIIFKTVENLKSYYEIFIRGGWSGIVEIIRRSDYLKGKKAEIISSEGIEYGIVQGMDKNGEIEISVDGELKKYCSGEISIKNFK